MGVTSGGGCLCRVHFPNVICVLDKLSIPINFTQSPLLVNRTVQLDGIRMSSIYLSISKYTERRRGEIINGREAKEMLSNESN